MDSVSHTMDSDMIKNLCLPAEKEKMYYKVTIKSPKEEGYHLELCTRKFDLLSEAKDFKAQEMEKIKQWHLKHESDRYDEYNFTIKMIKETQFFRIEETVELKPVH